MKDPDRIVRIEQAIAKKYGHETIDNPRKHWNEEKEKELLEVESQLKRGREDAAMFSHGNVEISRRGAT